MSMSPTDLRSSFASHLIGMFYRTIRMLAAGIKPVYVFDGAPPELKSQELARRSEKRKEAAKKEEEAKDQGDAEAEEKFKRRGVRITKQHNEECQRLLKLMGVPIVLVRTGVWMEAAGECCLTYRRQ